MGGKGIQEMGMGMGGKGGQELIGIYGGIWKQEPPTIEVS
jgi:hypothetical protein